MLCIMVARALTQPEAPWQGKSGDVSGWAKGRAKLARRYKSLAGFAIFPLGKRYSALRSDMRCGARRDLYHIAFSAAENISNLPPANISCLRQQTYHQRPPNGCRTCHPEHSEANVNQNDCRGQSFNKNAKRRRGIRSPMPITDSSTPSRLRSRSLRMTGISANLYFVICN